MDVSPDEPQARAAEIMESRLYADLGVSSAKDDVHRAVRILDPGIYPGAFCRVMPDIFTSDPDFCVLSHADGSGTKSILAYIHYKTHGDPAVFYGVAQDAIVMNLDDMLCVGAVGGFSLASIINRNAKRIDGSVLNAIVQGTADFIDLMNDYGIDMVHAGGETADLGDIVRTVTIDSVLTARMRRIDVVANNIVPGQAIVGLESGGPPSRYESKWNSGIASNGLTFARHALLRAPLGAAAASSLADDAIDDGLVYKGRFDLEAILPETDVTVLAALLSPTRTFAPVIKAMLLEHRPEISGLVHNSGGGQLKCLKSGSRIHYTKSLPTPIPPIFQELHASTSLNWGELAKVFNMGIRMEIYCDAEVADDLVRISESFGVGSRVVGQTAESNYADRNTLDLDVAGTTYSYSETILR